MAKLGKFVERGGDSQMNKRQKKKRFKKLYGMNPKQYQQAMQLVSFEEPLKRFMDSETKLSCESFYFWVEQIEKELKKRR